MADAKQVADEAVAAFNAHDEQRFRALYADDSFFEAPGDVRLEGPEAITGYAMAWLNAGSRWRTPRSRQASRHF